MVATAVPVCAWAKDREVITNIVYTSQSTGGITTAGKDGTDGQAGQDGLDGVSGQNGAHGQNGREGQSGQDGQDGASGKNGELGVGVVARTSATTSSVEFRKTRAVHTSTNGVQAEATATGVSPDVVIIETATSAKVYENSPVVTVDTTLHTPSSAFSTVRDAFFSMKLILITYVSKLF